MKALTAIAGQRSCEERREYVAGELASAPVDPRVAKLPEVHGRHATPVSLKVVTYSVDAALHHGGVATLRFDVSEELVEEGVGAVRNVGDQVDVVGREAPTHSGHHAFYSAMSG
jgi:hypothetical protein